MVLRRIGPVSLAKIMGVLYAALGLVAGAFLSLFATLGSALSGLNGEGGPGGAIAVFFGVGAVIILPFLYGALGFLAGLIGSGLYNLLAGWLGGVELEFGEKRPAV